MSKTDELMDALYRMGWRGRLIWWTIIFTGAACALGLFMLVLWLPRWHPIGGN